MKEPFQFKNIFIVGKRKTSGKEYRRIHIHLTALTEGINDDIPERINTDKRDQKHQGIITDHKYFPGC